MRLNNILEEIEIIASEGNLSVNIADISSDSRKVIPGSLFIAVKGTKTDGHLYIDKAVELGAVAVICSEIPVSKKEGVTWVKVKDTASALGIAASNFYGRPSSKVKLIGVTGTNGKTTIATLLYRMFSLLGYQCGLFSTVCNYVCTDEYPATHTTPDPVQLNSLMARMVEEKCTHVFMEVSSHAVDQKRISGLKFAGGIFTNLTHDHLDYHKTFGNYLSAKKSFFDSLSPDAFALVNADDKNSEVMLQNCRARKYKFSTHGVADFRASVIEQGMDGMELRIDREEVWVSFIGDYNASNLLAVYAAARLLGQRKRDILLMLSELEPVRGRLEVIRVNNITGIVDYAHTPDALINVIDTLNKIRQGKGQLITVVGAGGDRDRTKRPKMARICAEGSDKVILTSDNPRSEDPEKILDDMETGITPEIRPKVIRITNRREAIRTAVMMAKKGDVMLIAGKGHETYQEIKGVRYHFDDREELTEALKSKT